MKQIPLTKGEFALVDDADFEWLNKFKWCVKDDKKSGMKYAFRSQYVSKINGKIKNKIFYMHRIILDSKAPRVDHENRNGLDNQRHNIRGSTASQNAMNKKKPAHGITSQYKGVHFRKDSKKYRASIRINGKLKSLGSFQSELDAARAYDAAAKKMFGDFARGNAA